ncbi:hypothetical protein HID58_014736, partial [Brassica napus]
KYTAETLGHGRKHSLARLHITEEKQCSKLCTLAQAVQDQFQDHRLELHKILVFEHMRTPAKDLTGDTSVCFMLYSWHKPEKLDDGRRDNTLIKSRDISKNMTEEKVKKTMKRSADLIAIREEKVKGTVKRLPDFARIRGFGTVAWVRLREFNEKDWWRRTLHKRIGNGGKRLRFYDGYEAGEVDELLRADNVYILAHTKARLDQKIT